MKHRICTLIMLIAFFIPFISGCKTTGASDQDQVMVTDLLGRQVPVPSKVERVVAIGPGALRLYTYAGNLDFVVGVEQIEVDRPIGRPYLLANPSLSELPVIGQGGPNNAPDPEKILNVNPDVIFSTYATDIAAADELQSKTGIPVVAISYGTLGFGTTEIFGQFVQNSLRLIGEITGTTEKSQSAIDFIQQAQQDLENRTKDIPDSDKPSVYG